MSEHLLEGHPMRAKPFGFQGKEFLLRRDVPVWGVFWEQGLGKTKLDIDEAAYGYGRGEIDGQLVIAPSGVHRNWVTEEMPKHWPDEFGSPAMHWYKSDSAATKRHQAAVRDVINAKGCFSLLSMSYDSLLTDEGRKSAKEFLLAGRRRMVADESGRMKNPTARRTKVMLKAAEFAPIRRVLDGTPVPNSPFDVYSVIKFLDKMFWERHGIGSFQGFKSQFGVWGSGYVATATGTREFPQLLAYRNLEILNAWLKEISSRLTKEEAGLDLPPKLYKRLTYPLSGAQRKVYDALRDECMAFLESGEMVTTTLALTNLLRLQQVACGYVPVDEAVEDPIRQIGADSPRLDLLMEVVEDTPHKAIVWARFRRDIDDIMAAMAKAGKNAVRYDGSMGDDGLATSAESFQRGDAQFFVANQAKGCEGLTLLGDQRKEELSCKTVIYFSNSYNLRHRLQSEDRAHRIGQRWPVQYIDIVAQDTVDERVVEKLKAKYDVAAMVTGDRLKEWIA